MKCWGSSLFSWGRLQASRSTEKGRVFSAASHPSVPHPPCLAVSGCTRVRGEIEREVMGRAGRLGPSWTDSNKFDQRLKVILLSWWWFPGVFKDPQCGSNHPSNHSSVHPSIHPTIPPSTHPSTHPACIYWIGICALCLVSLQSYLKLYYLFFCLLYLKSVYDLCPSLACELFDGREFVCLSTPISTESKTVPDA